MTEENITETLNTAVTALKEFDTDNLKKYIDSPTLSYIIGYAEKKQQFADLGKAIFANLEVDVKSIDTENATISLSVKNKDLYESAKSFTTQLTSQYTSLQLLSKLNDDSFLDLHLTALCNEIDKCTMQTSASQITLGIAADSKNLVLVFDEDAEDAVSGGALSAIKSVI